MGAFAEAQTCRRLVPLNYFMARRSRAGTAISALDPPKQYDGSTDAQIALFSPWSCEPAVWDGLRGGSDSWR